MNGGTESTGQAKTRLTDRVSGVNLGAEEGTRTPDPLITNELLYQLSYFGLTGQCAQSSLMLVEPQAFVKVAVARRRAPARPDQRRPPRPFGVDVPFIMVNGRK